MNESYEPVPMSQATTQSLSYTQENLDLTQEVWGRLLSLEGQVQSFALSENEYSFGRGIGVSKRFTPEMFENQLLKAISKHHFTIKRTDATCEVILKDFSHNGTFINKTLVGRGKETILQNNDEISLAAPNKKVFIFYDCMNNDAAAYSETLTMKYILSRLIGQGAYGTVHLGYTKVTLERCAIKVMKKSISRGDNVMQFNQMSQIENEVKLLQSIDHPCIVHLMDFIESSEHIYIIMELANGGELYDRIVKEHHLSEGTTKLYMYQLICALRYLHENKITHRDLKPENILLATDDEFTRVKLTDFGFSKLCFDVSQMSTFCGTQGYSAPELLDLSDRHYTNKVDIWSYGVVLFVCLSGYPPFVGRNDVETRYRVIRGVFNFNREVWTCVSKEAKDLIQQILVVDPAKRPDVEGILRHPWFKDSQMVEKAHELMETSDDRKTLKRRCCFEDDEMPDGKTPCILNMAVL